MERGRQVGKIRSWGKHGGHCRLGLGDGSRLEPKGASPYVGSFLKQKPVRFWFSPVLPDTIHL